MRKNIIILILISLVAITLTSCSNSEFDSEYKKFKESYVIATSFVEEDNDSLKAIQKMDIEIVELGLKNMKDSMDRISNGLNSKTEQGIYGNLESYYNNLEFLLYAAKNIDQLTIEEKLKADIKVISTTSNRNSIIRGEK